MTASARGFELAQSTPVGCSALRRGPLPPLHRWTGRRRCSRHGPLRVPKVVHPMLPNHSECSKSFTPCCQTTPSAQSRSPHAAKALGVLRDAATARFLGAERGKSSARSSNLGLTDILIAGSHHRRALAVQNRIGGNGLLPLRVPPDDASQGWTTPSARRRWVDAVGPLRVPHDDASQGWTTPSARRR